MTSLRNRFYDGMRSPSARSIAAEHATVQGFEHLRGHKYCVLVTYKRTGEAVPTPVWFGLENRTIYIRSEANAAKVRRIGNDPRVRVAPCDVRGKPLGPPAEGRARILGEPFEEARAEAALQANYGLGRRLYERIADADSVYLEIASA
jgi:uncharacterized protein